MHVDTLNQIRNSQAMIDTMSNKHFIDSHHLDTFRRGDGFGHCLIIWFSNEISSKEISEVGDKLKRAHNFSGESVWGEDVIKFYGNVKQLLLN